MKEKIAFEELALEVLSLIKSAVQVDLACTDKCNEKITAKALKGYFCLSPKNVKLA
jgi:hypothetical protein